MWDFIVAIGLVLALEGLLFAAFPGAAKQAMANVLETPDTILRGVGIASRTDRNRRDLADSRLSGVYAAWRRYPPA